MVSGRRGVYVFLPVLAVSLGLGLLLCGTSCRSWRGPARSEVLQIRTSPVLGDVFSELCDAFSGRQSATTAVTASGCPVCMMPLGSGEAKSLDVLVCVGTSDMKRFTDAGAIDPATVEHLGTTRLVLVVPKASELKVHSLADLASDQVGRIQLGDPQSLSLGACAEQALRAAGVWNRVRSKIADCKTGCEVLKTVSLGEAEVGFVYEFCLSKEPDPRVRELLTVPQELHDPIFICMGLSRGAAARPGAQAFRDFVGSPAGRGILEQRGIRAPAAVDAVPGGGPA